MDSKYAETDGRKVVYSSLNPIDLLKNANIFTFVVLAVIVVLISVIVLAVVLTVKKIKKKTVVKK